MPKIFPGLATALLVSCLFSPNLPASNRLLPVADTIIQPIVVAKNQPKVDSSTRTGTENWEQPQGSFFVVPALIFGIFAIILYFNRD
jgi:hypothetical protein